jgi:hypothetical protein
MREGFEGEEFPAWLRNDAGYYLAGHSEISIEAALL